MLFLFEEKGRRIRANQRKILRELQAELIVGKVAIVAATNDIITRPYTIFLLIPIFLPLVACELIKARDFSHSGENRYEKMNTTNKRTKNRFARYLIVCCLSVCPVCL